MNFRSLFWITVIGGGVLLTPATVSAQLSGDYLIGAGQTYTSLKAAIDALNLDGASGQVRFLINQDLTESGSPNISQIALDGTNASLVIKPAPGKTPTVTFKNCVAAGTGVYHAQSGLTINGGTTVIGYVTIDGSNAPGGTTRDLTFVLSDTTNGRYCVKIADNADNITIKNLNVTVDSLQIDRTGIGYTYDTGGIAVLGGTTAGRVADNLIITNCRVYGSSPTYRFKNGIYVLNGSGGATYAGPVTITNNDVTADCVGIDLVRGNKTGTKGTISGNTVSLQSIYSAGYTHAGIFLENWQDTVSIFNNKCVTLAAANTYTSGLTLNGIIATIGQVGSVVNCYNNFISDFQLSGSTISNNVYGINVNHSSSTGNAAVHNIYHNTVILNNSYGNTGTFAALRLSANTVNANTVNVKNNIFVNTITKTLSYAVYCLRASMSLVASDYNDLYADTLGYFTTVRTTFADWKTATTQDAHSINVNPTNPFGAAGRLTSLTNLHWFSAPQSAFAGTPIVGITKDIDDENRNATTPYMGADEAGPFTGIGDEGTQPNQFSLGQNYPNPFNPSTAISYQLSAVSKVELRIFDMLGREVAVLVNEVQTPGLHSVRFDASKLQSGAYFYRLIAGESQAVRKMVLLK